MAHQTRIHNIVESDKKLTDKQYFAPGDVMKKCRVINIRNQGSHKEGDNQASKHQTAWDLEAWWSPS